MTKKECDLCGKFGTVKKVTRKQLLKKEKCINTKTEIRKTESGKVVPFVIRIPKFIDRIMPNQLKNIYPLLKKLEDKHKWARKSRLCKECMLLFEKNDD